MYTLSLDPFLVAAATKGKKTRGTPLRRFVDDGGGVEPAETSIAIENIWQTIRLHYGFQSSDGHFLDSDIQL